jgi:hypothetical protein
MEKKNEGLLEAMYSHLNAAYLANTKVPQLLYR